MIQAPAQPSPLPNPRAVAQPQPKQDRAMLTEVPLSMHSYRHLQQMFAASLETPVNRIEGRLRHPSKSFAKHAAPPKLTVSHNRVAPQKTGGINLSRTIVDVESSGDEVGMVFDDPTMLRLLLNSNGLTPIINSVKIMTPSMKSHYLGLN